MDLRMEQESSRARPRYPYSAVARLMYRAMDTLTGAPTTLAKARLVELLAPIPYRAYENAQHARMALGFEDAALVGEGRAIVEWAREAEDNEYWHLRVVNEKLRQEAVQDPRYMARPVPFLLLRSYAVAMWVLTRLSRRRAFLLNAELEDHSEHVYAELVHDHPEWDDQPVESALVREFGSFDSWADVFRRIGLDERDHMNASLVFAGRRDLVVEYEGGPTSSGAGEGTAAA
ncbi:MAG TPA: hypothetical protein VK576_03640 [Thermoleophilia bacterium]|nr:hypothetical protein [Thermoleophilia bacterium]